MFGDELLVCTWNEKDPMKRLHIKLSKYSVLGCLLLIIIRLLLLCHFNPRWVEALLAKFRHFSRSWVCYISEIAYKALINLCCADCVPVVGTQPLSLALTARRNAAWLIAPHPKTTSFVVRNVVLPAPAVMLLRDKARPTCMRSRPKNTLN